MKGFFIHIACLTALLLTFISCSRERKEVSAPQEGGVVTIHVGTAALERTKADTPGSDGAGDGGSFSDYSMHFDVPAVSTLSVCVSDNSAGYSLAVLAGGVVTTEVVNSSGSKQIDFHNIPEGRVTIYPVGGALKIYEISYTHAGGTKTWDFANSTFQAMLAAITPLHPHPDLDASGPWDATIDGLTIWSKGNSTWNTTGGYFEFAGGYTGTDDLIILIANSAGDIVITYPDSERPGIPYGTIENQTAVEATLKFDFSTLAAGPYTVYAFGNTSGLWEMTDGTDDYATGSDLLSLTTKTQVDALRFKDQERNTIGWDDAGYAEDWDDGVIVENGRLPVSAKASLTVSSGRNGEAYLELLRCVAKVTAIIKNNTGDALDLVDYRHTVHNINPSSGYVIPRESDDFCGTAGNLLQYPDKKYHSSTPIHISEVGSEEYSWYVFPSQGPYTICIGFTENSSGEPIDHAYYKLPITNWRQQNIPELKRNQHLIVTTRLSVGKTVSFNFTVNDWDDDHVSSVQFD